MRGFRHEPDVYFGRPGAMVTLPWPKGGMDAPYDRQAFDFLTGSGQHRVSKLIGGSREYTLTWAALHQRTYQRIEQYERGMMGEGPWAFIDPSRPNLLTPQQSSATVVWKDTRGFAVGGTTHGAISSQTTIDYIHRAGSTRSLKWFFAGGHTATPVLSLNASWNGWAGIPVVGSLPYAWSFWIRPDGVVDTSMTFAAKVEWFSAAGVSLGLTSGPDTAVTGWTQLSWTGLPPTNAAYAKPRAVGVSATFTAGSAAYLDEFLFEQDDTINDWAPGTGVNPVEIMSLTETVPFATRMRTSPSLVLREVVG